MSRRIAAALLTVCLSVGAAACADDEEASAPSASASVAESPPSPSATAAAGEGVEAGAYPVTIEHKYGSTEITAEAERVVLVGLSDIDPVLALGVTPVGYIDWYGDPQYPNGIWPWAEEAFGDAAPEVMPRNGDKFLFEQIAALRPDLIIGQYTGMTQGEYDLLTEIAPTVAQSAEFDDYTTPWQDMTQVIGQALGRPARADELIAEIDAAFDAARERYPELGGASAIFAERFESGKSYPRGTEEPRVRFLSEFGLEIPAEITSFAGKSGADLSDERMDLLDTADVLVWNLYEDRWREDLENNEIYQGLEVNREGRAIFVEDVLGGALTWSSVLSLPFAIEGLAPQLAAALDGDPATTADINPAGQTAEPSASRE